MVTRRDVADPLAAADELALGERRITETGLLWGRPCWVERAPGEGNTPRLLTRGGKGPAGPVAPESGLYGYGGGGWAAGRDTLAWVDGSGALSLTGPDGGARTLVGPSRDAPRTFGDLAIGERGRVIAVRERGGDPRWPAHDIVSVDPATGRTSVLAEGEDFYLSPRVGPDGHWLAYLSWGAPGMPWTAARAHLLRLGPDGRPAGRPRRVGTPAGVVREIAWLADGRLLLVVEDEGCSLWTVRPEGGAAPRLWWRTGAELGAVPWQAGLRTVAETGDGALAVLAVEHGRGQLWIVERHGAAHLLPLPFTAYPQPTLSVRDDHAYVVAGSPDMFPALVGIDLARRRWTVLRSTFEPRPREEPPPTVRAFTTELNGGHAVETVVTAPARAADPGAARPVVLDCHSGPTDQAFLMLTPLAWYLASLGLVVAQVNYRGSTGYGRVFRDALAGGWGSRDVADVVGVLDAAGDRHWSQERVFLRGESAGGLTILGVARERRVAGLVSLHGAVDGASLRTTTHKFESGYIDWLLGPEAGQEPAPGPGAPAGAGCPALIVAGSDDTVVPPAQARRLADRLGAAGGAVRLLEFPGQGHGLDRPEAVRRALRAEGRLYRSLEDG
ncbi:S9 family peptidase [Streptomyces marincola]|uniref:S9 family peptidase n=1 Tax=Streptomyces marincola TaxID=2878388 RepID=UPI00131C2899|nr:prolyl oligopeptidase family serine peptidase [Streptomyces marincola]